MLNLAFALFPSLTAHPATKRQAPAEKGVLAKLSYRAGEQIRYLQAMHALRQLDDGDLDDLGIARVDFPALARRHAAGAAPLAPSQVAAMQGH
jgi:uncharacterized protein YjiS (DUF1127 family)